MIAKGHPFSIYFVFYFPGILRREPHFPPALRDASLNTTGCSLRPPAVAACILRAAAARATNPNRLPLNTAEKPDALLRNSGSRKPAVEDSIAGQAAAYRANRCRYRPRPPQDQRPTQSASPNPAKRNKPTGHSRAHRTQQSGGPAGWAPSPPDARRRPSAKQLCQMCRFRPSKKKPSCNVTAIRTRLANRATAFLPNCVSIQARPSGSPSTMGST